MNKASVPNPARFASGFESCWQMTQEKVLGPLRNPVPCLEVGFPQQQSVRFEGRKQTLSGKLGSAPGVLTGRPHLNSLRMVQSRLLRCPSAYLITQIQICKFYKYNALKSKQKPDKKRSILRGRKGASTHIEHSCNPATLQVSPCTSWVVSTMWVIHR